MEKEKKAIDEINRLKDQAKCTEELSECLIYEHQIPLKIELEEVASDLRSQAKEIEEKDIILQFGIEIVAAMKASSYGVSIEDGRAMANDLTTPESVANEDGFIYSECTDEDKETYLKIAALEKNLLHKQAMFVGEIAIKKYRELYGKQE